MRANTQSSISQKRQPQGIKYKHKKTDNKTSPQQQYETYLIKPQSSQRQAKLNRFVQKKKTKPQFLLYNKMNQKLEVLQSRIEEIKAQIYKKNLSRMKRNIQRNQQLQQQKRKLAQKFQENKNDENTYISNAQFHNKNNLIDKNNANSQSIMKNQGNNSKIDNNNNKQTIKQNSHQKQQNIQTNLNQFITQQNPSSKNYKIPQNISISNLVTSVPQTNGHAFDINPYSPRSSIYYVSQVIKGYKDKHSLVYQHLKTSIFLFNYFSHIRLPLNSQIQKRMLNLPIKPGYQGKKTIIFDLDQTLIHCTQNIDEKHQIQLPITFPNGSFITAGINVRPGAKQILQALYQDFQLVVFTASHYCYANVVIDYLDPQKKYIQHRLYRDHCHITTNREYVKDLRIINRQLKNMVLIDNAAYSYAFQPQNGVPIIPYYHGQKDYELKVLTTYIQKLQFVQDVRLQNRKIFKLLKYRDYKPNQIQKLVQDLYLHKNQ